MNYAEKFYEIMCHELIQQSLLIKGTITFIDASKDSYTMHIVSGSDELKLRYITTE